MSPGIWGGRLSYKSLSLMTKLSLYISKLYIYIYSKTITGAKASPYVKQCARALGTEGLFFFFWRAQ